ncbi:apoptosis-associated speck-like protein containing a CARD isoform X6 [Chelonia mydas]|uniref:apoptosis-associated speck-like protein containing a CARD isoform X6 n=1 Tax=Chelonia mydas TaxID=8469 RepID=UPI001CA96F40|nr:apoptosis-associated speck-like protein containing a CARD isoform X6 [Chelonia mydas]
MGKTLRDHLFDTIRELGKSGLKTFKDKLNNFQPKEGYNPIRWGELENADAVEITRLLVSYYKEDYAVEVAGKVLEDMDEKKLAHNLFQATGKAGVADPTLGKHKPGLSSDEDSDLLRRLQALKDDSNVTEPQNDVMAPALETPQ